MLYKKLLKSEYQISEKDLYIIKTSYEQLTKTDIEKDILYCSLVEDIVKNSICELDYNMNWGKLDIIEKRWFLMYVLYPVHTANSHKEVLNIVYNQHSMNITFRNTILLMFDRDELRD